MTKFLGRIGSSNQSFSYEVTFHELLLSVPRPLRINIVWKRRKRRAELKDRPALSPSVGSVEIDQTLSMINTLYLKKDNFYQKKEAVFLIQGMIDSSVKSLGRVTIDISKYTSVQIKNQFFSLENCPDPNGKISISISCTMVDKPDDLRSKMTDGRISSEDNLPDLFGRQFTFKPDLRLPPIETIKERNSIDDERTTELIAELDIARKELSRIEAEKEDFQAQCKLLKESLNKERKKYTESMQSVEITIDNLKANNAELEDKLALKNDKAIKRKTETEMLRSQNEQIKVEKESLEQERQELKAAIADNSENLRIFEKKYEKVSQKKSNYKNKLKVLYKNYQELEQNLSSNNSEDSGRAQKLELENRELLSTQEVLTKNIRDLERLMQKQENQYKEINEKNQGEIEHLTSEIRRLTHESKESSAQANKALRQSALEKNKLQSKLNRMTKNLSNIQSIPQTTVEESESSHEEYQKKIHQYQELLKSREQALQEVLDQKHSVEEENFGLKSSLNKFSESEFSDPANDVLREEIQRLKDQIEMYKTEQISSSNNKKVLEKQIDIINKQLRETKQFYEDKVASLRAEVETIRKDSEQRGTVSIMEIETSDLRRKITQLNEEKLEMEKNFINAKTERANVEVENESFRHKVRELTEDNNYIKNEFSMLEVEFYKINERLGLVLNSNNELEQVIFELRKTSKKKK